MANPFDCLAGSPGSISVIAEDISGNRTQNSVYCVVPDQKPRGNCANVTTIEFRDLQNPNTVDDIELISVQQNEPTNGTSPRFSEIFVFYNFGIEYTYSTYSTLW